jgi:glycerophosphoryl diester phosphodiesterase
MGSMNRKFVPEVKKPDPSTVMPFNGFTQEMYVQKVIDEYKQAGVSPSKVWVQSFEYPDILQLIKTEPEFAKQAVLLDDEVCVFQFAAQCCCCNSILQCRTSGRAVNAALCTLY